MRRTWALIALVVSIATLVLAAPAGATFPGANGFVVFSSSRDGDFNLFAQDLNGSNLRKLVSRPGTNEFNPSWNRSGSRLVFQSGPLDGSDFDLYLVNANGTGLTPLLVGATNDLRGQFCDDDTLVFQRNVAGVGDIYAIETDGTGLRRLTDDLASDSTPTCSPDGSKVAFSSTRNGVQGIYEVPLASAQAARLPLLASPTLLAANALDADYAPKGTTLAYAGPDPADGNTEIFTKNLATGAVTKITSSAPPVQNRLPKFYPSGSSGLAARSLAGEVEDLSNTRVNADGSHDLCLDSGDCAPFVGDADSGATQPGPCHCVDLDVNIIEKSVSIKDGKGREEFVKFTLKWKLGCSGAPGESCTGELALVTRGNKVVQKPSNSLVGCEGSCKTGRRATKSGKQLVVVRAPRGGVEDHELVVDVNATCNGQLTTYTFTILFSGSKVLAIEKKETP